MYGGIALVAGLITGRRAVRLGLLVVAIVVTAIVGYCRMYRGFHYPTDVIAGFVLGVICLATAWIPTATATAIASALERVRCRNDHDPHRRR